MSKFWKIIKGTFWAMVLTASLFIIFSSLNIFGYQTFVVKSGSMEPEIKTGSIVIDKKDSGYKVDNVVTYKLNDSKDTVTHRIIAINTTDGVTEYTTKGDANRTPDPDPVLQANIVGKVLFSVPFIGYLIAFMRTLPGLVIFIFIPAVIIISDEISNIKAEAKNIKMNKNRRKYDSDDDDIPYTPPNIHPASVQKPKTKQSPKIKLIQ